MRRLFATAAAVVAALVPGGAGVAQPTNAGTWTTSTPLTVARSEVSVAAVGGTIYVIGGYAAAGSRPLALDSTGRVDVDEPLVQAYVPAGGPVNGGSRQADTLLVFRQP